MFNWPSNHNLTPSHVKAKERNNYGQSLCVVFWYGIILTGLSASPMSVEHKLKGKHAQTTFY